MQGTKWDRIMKHLVESLEGIDGTAEASTAVNQDTAKGTRVLKVTSTSGFVTGRPVMIDAGGDREEITTPVESIDSGAGTITLQQTDFWAGFEFDHDQVDADTVKQDWFNYDVDRIESWSETAIPMAMSPFPSGSVLSLEEAPRTVETNTYEQARGFQVTIWMDVQKREPEDQTNDQIYQKILADEEKAIMADWTRGGEAINTRITLRRPLSELDLPEYDPTKTIPLVGAFIQGQIDYRHRVGDLYQ